MPYAQTSQLFNIDSLLEELQDEVVTGETLDLFVRAIQSAHDCGNNECASFATFSWSSHAFYASIELAQVEERALKLRAFVDRIQYVTQSRWVNIIFDR